MARRPTFSPTKLAMYLACPLLYRWTYVHPQPWLVKRKSYFSFGLSLHKAVEQFHRTGDQGLPIKEQLHALLELSWLDAGYLSADEMAEAFGEGMEILGEAADQDAFTPPEGNIVAVEKSFRLRLEEFDLVGRIDRLDELPDGTLEILDYKTGRRSFSQADVDDDIALSCYQLMVRAAYPNRTVCASIYNMRDQSKVTTRLSEEAHDEFLFAVQELGHSILCHEWAEVEPIRKPLCVGCDFLSLCSRHPNF